MLSQMAAAIVSHRCSKCTKTIGTISCDGCQEIFCTKHITKHRTELSTEFNEHMLKHDLLLKRLLAKEEENQFSKNDILAQINQWEKYMIERIRYKAELARDRLDELTKNDDKVLIQDAQELTKKINKRDTTENLLEQDIEQLKQSVINTKQALSKTTALLDIELYIEPSHMIDWNHLIYLRKKPVKIDTLSESNSCSESSSSDSSEDENEAQENNSSYIPYSSMRRLSGEQVDNSTQPKPSPSQSQKQLTSTKFSDRSPSIVDQKTNQTIKLTPTISPTDISRTPTQDKTKTEIKSSSPATNNIQQQDKMADRLAELLRGSLKT